MARAMQVSIRDRPIEFLSSICVEDLVLMKPVSEEKQVELEEAHGGRLQQQYDIAVSSVCFSFGNLHGRMELPLDSLHKNVPGFAESLRKMTDAVRIKLSTSSLAALECDDTVCAVC